MRKVNDLIHSIRFLCVLTAGVFLLSACGKTEEKHTGGNTSEMESDAVETDLAYRFVAESENGYYFWERENASQHYPRLMFKDKETGQVVPLCNKPDCVHEGEECNAFFPKVTFTLYGIENGYGIEDGIHKEYIQYYDGNLYAVGLSADDYVTLFCIKADGSEWKISTKLFRTDYEATGQWYTPEVLIDDGYVYFVDRKQRHMKLERIPINGKNVEVVFDVDSEMPVDIHWLKSNGGVIFFEVVDFVDENWENAVDSVYCYDPKVGQCRMVKELGGSYSVQNGAVYYTNEGEFCRYSIEKQSTEMIADMPMDFPNITLTKNYIIFCDALGDYSLTICDYEGKVLATVPNTVRLHWYFGGNSDMLFGECVAEGGLDLLFLDLTRPLEELQWEKLAAD